MRRCADNVGRRVDTEVSTPRLAGTATPLHLRRLCPAPTYDHVVAQRRPLRRRQRHLPSEHVNSTAHRHKHPRGRVRSFSNSRGVRTQGGISPKNAKIRLSNTHTTVLRPFFRDHPGDPVPEENFWTLWCKGRLTEADTLTIRLGATPSGLSSAHLHHPLIFYRSDALPATQPTVSKH